MTSILGLLKAMAPHGLVKLRNSRIAARMKARNQIDRESYHAIRHQRIDSLHSQQTDNRILDGTDYESLVSFLIRQGLDEHHVREGSVPPASLDFLQTHVIRKLPSGRPLVALHIGNFVGVSLAFLTASLTRRNSESIVFSIDPNIPHRGIINPQSHVLALLSACGLQRNSLVLTGYSSAKSVSNDATVFENYDPMVEFNNEVAPENTLSNLASFFARKFDVVFLDGNHDANYLLSELRQIVPLLQYNGFVVLDDVDTAWEEIREVFSNIGDLGLVPGEANGRIGIAQLPASKMNERTADSMISRHAS